VGTVGTVDSVTVVAELAQVVGGTGLGGLVEGDVLGGFVGWFLWWLPS
jgi:hypothetical protein